MSGAKMKPVGPPPPLPPVSDIWEDWQMEKSILECNRHMLENQLECDVKFTFIPPEGLSFTYTQDPSISAHKYMLISRSPVFYAMLAGPAKDESGIIHIQDIDQESFREMLRFMYYENVSLNGDNILTLLYAAKKYLIPALEKKCREFLNQQLCPTNVCPVLDQVHIIGDETIEKHCLKIIDENAQEMLSCENFADLKKETMWKIISRDTLDVSEVTVWSACVRWAKNECQRQGRLPSDEEQRNVLGDLIFAIRFPTMSLEDFSKYVANTGILTDNEVRGLFTLLTGTKPKAPPPFPTKKRAGANSSYLVQFDDIDVVMRKVQMGPGYNSGIRCQIEITNQVPNEQVYISEIYFCNTANVPINDVRMERANFSVAKHFGQPHTNSTGKVFKASAIEKSGLKDKGGFPVYRAVFNESIATSNDNQKIQIQFNSTYNGKGHVPYIQNLRMSAQEQSHRGLGMRLYPQFEMQSQCEQMGEYMYVRFGATEQSKFVAHASSFSLNHKDRQIAIRLGDGRQWAVVVGLKLKVVPLGSV